MRPEKLGFEDCDLDVIFKNLTKNFEPKIAESSESSTSSIKAGKSPQSENIGTSKVKSYYKIVEDSGDPKNSVVNKPESCEEFKSPSDSTCKGKNGKHPKSSWPCALSRHKDSPKNNKCHLPDNTNSSVSSIDKSESIKTSSRDTNKGTYCEKISKVDPNIANKQHKNKNGNGFIKEKSSKCPNNGKSLNEQNSDFTSVLGPYLKNNFNKGHCDKNFDRYLKNKNYCKEKFKDEYLRKQCEEYIEQELSKIRNGDKGCCKNPCRDTHDNCLGNKCERNGIKCPNNHLNDDSSSNSSVLSSRKHRRVKCNVHIKDECRRYPENTSHKDTNNPSTYSSYAPKNISCFICQEKGGKQLKNECDKYLQNCSKKDNIDSKEDESRYTLNISSGPETRRDHPKGFNNKYNNKKKCACSHNLENQKDRCEKYVHRRCITKHMDDNDFDSKPSFSSTGPKRLCHDISDKHYKTKCEKFVENNYSEIRSGDRPSSYSKYCHKEHLPHEISDRNVKPKCGECVEIKCSKKHFGDNSNTVGSDSSQDSSSNGFPFFPSFTKSKDARKKESAPNSESSDNEHCDEELCQKWKELKKKSDKELCKMYNAWLKKKNSSRKDLNKDPSVCCLPVLKDTVLKSPSNGSKSDISSIDRSTDDNIPTSQVCLYLCPCHSGRNTQKIKVALKACPQSDENTLSESESRNISVADSTKTDKQPSTIWSCLSILLGKNKKSDTEISTANQKMDSPSENKKSFTNPRKIPDSESNTDNSKKCVCKHTDLISQSTEDSNKKHRESNISDEDKFEEAIKECKRKLQEECESDKSRPIPKNVSQPHSDSKESEQVKSFRDAHCETMATIKYAMQDLASKVYNSTSEAAAAAVSLIQTESSKQIDNFNKSFNCEDESNEAVSPNKRKTQECTDGEPDEVRKLIHNVDNDPKNKDNVPQKSIFDQIAAQVDSVVSVVSSTVSTVSDNVEFLNYMKPRSVNDDSSQYDVPDPNLNKKNQAVKKVSNVMNNDTSTSTNSIFSSIKTKILAMFGDVEGDTVISSEESGSSVLGVTNDNESDEDLMNKLIE